jgi:hypothetical protein
LSGLDQSSEYDFRIAASDVEQAQGGTFRTPAIGFPGLHQLLLKLPALTAVLVI